MNQFLFIGICLWCGNLAVVATNEQPEPINIPLDQIWAWQMPGTRDIAKLEPDKPANYAYGPFVAAIRRSLAIVPLKGNEGKPGFAALGTGLQALREARAVLAEKNRPRKTFPMNNDISVVFFSYQFGPYVHVHSVERQGNTVDIHYRFVPHESEISTEGIAIIPLGKLPLGKYQVNISQSGMEQKYLDLGFRPVSDVVARKIVCGSFSFSVTEQGE